MDNGWSIEREYASLDASKLIAISVIYTMLARSTKRLFYVLASPWMRLNAWLYRKWRFPKHESCLKVHLGPGQGNYLPGWINCDANMFTGKCDVWIDLRYSLPFPDASIDAIYSHHVVEHLPNLEEHLREVYRVLKPGGIYRVGGPHGDNAIQKFMEADHVWFGSWPDNRRRSIGGRFENFIFCRGEHLTILTQSFLTEVLEDASFVHLQVCMPARETRHPDFFSACLGYEQEAQLCCAAYPYSWGRKAE